jgi:formate/nitrite transporter FocA (FNT family)
VKANKKPARSRQQTELISCLAYTSTLKMEVICSSETFNDTFTALHGLFQKRTKINIMDIEVLTVVAMKSSIFWDVIDVVW